MDYGLKTTSCTQHFPYFGLYLLQAMALLEYSSGNGVYLGNLSIIDIIL